MRLKRAKTVYFIMVGALTVSGFITVCTLGQTVRRHRVETKIAAAAAEQHEAPLYIVRETGGRVAVFRDGEAEPFMYVDVLPSLLTEQDRALLREGLCFGTEQGLRRFIEDISS